jgi:hypothetical protein
VHQLVWGHGLRLLVPAAMLLHLGWFVGAPALLLCSKLLSREKLLGLQSGKRFPESRH